MVYPKDVDSSGKTISILAPAGSALLGLPQGDEIEWQKLGGGGLLRVKITEIVYQPERAGEFQRRGPKTCPTQWVSLAPDD